MRYSEYQIEMLIKRFRRLRGMWPFNLSPVAPRNDTVCLTDEARERGAPHAESPDYPVADLGEVSENVPYDGVVTRELERRAGSFMTPQYQPEGEPPRFRKIRYDEKA